MSKWITAWGVPTSYVAEQMSDMLRNTTFRHIFYSPINGKKIRLTFSNEYGEQDDRLEKVTIAAFAGNLFEIDTDTLKEITFEKNGKTLKMGQTLFSDEVEYTLEAGKQYVINIYFKDTVIVRTGYSKYVEDKLAPCFCVRGDHTESKSLPLDTRLEHRNYLFLTGADVLSDDDSASAIMAFGDSITARPWPDYLARRINSMGITNRSVVRKAIGGNRVLRDYQNYLAKRGMGVAGIRRFERDLLSVAGCDTVIMLQGINDLFHPKNTNLFCQMDQMPTADELIDGYKFCCDTAHKHGAKFYLGTILPTRYMVSYNDDRNDRRIAVNEWIRNNDVTDGYIEFDKFFIDKDDPTRLSPLYNSGDDLHPNLDGSQLLCDLIPEKIITKQ